MRGQVSNELLVVIGFILLILIPLLYIMLFKMDAIRADLALLQVHFSVARISFLVNAIGHMGDGSAMITEIYIPETVESAQISEHEVIFTMLSAGEINEVVRTTQFPMEDEEGFLGSELGTGKYRVEMFNEGGTVIISPQPDPMST
ncbi:MAG: hypothetical protein ACLFUZ_00050 [Candidatus Micrarchaeia archaeon]